MKKIIQFIVCLIIVIGATSCKKSWNCICTDNGNSITAATYKETNVFDAKAKCDAKQADVRGLFPNAVCQIK